MEFLFFREIINIADGEPVFPKHNLTSKYHIQKLRKSIKISLLMV